MNRALIQILILALFSAFSWGGLHRSSFTSDVKADAFIFSMVDVPRFAAKLEINIWAEQTQLKPTVLLRYDGLPTMDRYDTKLEIPQMPLKLVIVDTAPTQGSLYLAVFGGVEINRYRYFAGSPSTVLVGIETLVQSCYDVFNRGVNCTSAQPLMAGVPLAAAAQESTSHFYTVQVPNNQEYLMLTIHSKRLAHDLCENRAANVSAESSLLRLVVDLYMDQPDEDFNSARQSEVINTTLLCAHYKQNGTASRDAVEREARNIVLTVFVPRPLPGLWTARVALEGVRREDEDGRNEISMKSARVTRSGAHAATPRGQRLLLQVVDTNKEELAANVPKNKHFAHNDSFVAITVTATTAACPEGATNAQYYNISDVAAQRWGQVTSLQCAAPVQDMSAIATPMVARGYFALSGAPVAFPSYKSKKNDSDALAGARASPFVVFKAELPQRVRLAAVGGGILVEMKVSIASPEKEAAFSRQQFFSQLDVLRFTCAVRVGNFPEDPAVSAVDEAALDTALSLNDFVLASRDATVRNAGAMDDQEGNNSSADDDEDDDNEGNSGGGSSSQNGEGRVTSRYYRRYSWVVSRAYLPALMASGGPPLYLRISADDTNPAIEGRVDHQSPSSRGLLTAGDLQVSAALILEPCPEGACVHGTCYTQLGDVPASTCSCRYPWEGEQCDRLSMAYWDYLLQVLMVVLSNFAMLPAVILCLRSDHPFLAVMLAVSAISSALYHLCDTDVYCVAGLPFYSLQVLDVLMSLVSIASALLLYAPISKPMHNALSLLCMCVLVAYVSSDPTSPVNIAVAAGFALVCCAAGWLVVHGACGERCSSSSGCSKDAFYGCDRPQGSKGSAAVYSELSQNSSVGIIHGDISHSAGSSDIEMTSRQEGGEEGSQASEGEDSPPYTAPTDTRTWLKRLCVPVLGVVSGLTGLLSFALQGRDNYYLMHSLWHVSMMVAAYLMVRGRVDLTRRTRQ